MVCEHWECPYKNCNYHEDSTNIYRDLCKDEIPIYDICFPKNEDEVRNCMMYLDI